MRIYKFEKDDNINFDTHKEGSSAAFVTAQVRVCDIEKYFDGMSVSDLVKATSTVQTVEELTGQKQPDLALVVAILVSTGWNLNDDIFLPEELWKARSSPIHKPMNDNHDPRKILGHIVQSRVLDKSGNEVGLSDDKSIPESFDIEVAGVLYRSFPELSARIDEIISKAKSGEMFVSMEAWFPDFGYGLIDPTTGDVKLVERSEETAFLTKHLRIYGGCGEYQGYKIGRVLRDIIFGAQGFVDDPANPESVIKVAAKEIVASHVFVKAELDELLEGGAEGMEKQLEVLQAKLDEAQANLASKETEISKLQKVAEELKSKDYEGQIAALTTKVEELKTIATEISQKVKDIETAKSDVQTQLDEMTERAEKSDAELKEIRKNAVAQDRLAKLSKVKKIDDEKATLAELCDMTDETFALVLKYAGEIESVSTENSKKNSTTDDKEAERAEAALNSVEENKNDPDFNTVDDTENSKKDQWVSVAKKLLRREDDKN